MEGYVRGAGLDGACLIDYIEFLCEQREYSKAIEKGEKLYKYFEREGVDEDGKEIWARICNALATSYYAAKRFDGAEKQYQEAWKIYHCLVEVNPQKYEPALADICNNLGTLYTDMNQYAKAAEAYREALEIRHRLAKADPQAYEPALANSCNDLGNLYLYMNQYTKANELFSEALEIAERHKDTDNICRQIFDSLTPYQI